MEVRLLGGCSREVDFNRYYRPWKLDLRGAEIITEEFGRGEGKRLVEEIVISFVFNDGLFKRKKKEEEERRTSQISKKARRFREIQRRNSPKNFFLLRSSRNAISLAFFSRPPPFRASFPASISILHL